MTAVGIDISKLTFDAHVNNSNHRYVYSAEGIEAFIKILPMDAHCVMESTGPYFCRLAEALAFSGKKVSVV